MNFTNKNTKVVDLQKNEWYYIEPEFDHVNEKTAIKYDGKRIQISYIGGDFLNQ